MSSNNFHVLFSNWFIVFYFFQFSFWSLISNFVLPVIFIMTFQLNCGWILFLHQVLPVFFKCQYFVVIDKKTIVFRLVWWHACQAGVSFNMMNVTRLSTIGLLVTSKISLHMCRTD